MLRGPYLRAVQFTGKNINEIENFINPKDGFRYMNPESECRLYIDNDNVYFMKFREDNVLLEKGDYITRDTNWNTRVYKKAEFEGLYKEIKDNNTLKTNK